MDKLEQGHQTDFLWCCLNSEVRRRHLKMIPLVSLTFILAIKGAAAQNATDTNQVRSVQCRRYGTYDIIYTLYILQYMWHYLHFVTYMWNNIQDVTYLWHENWPGYWRIHHIHRLSGICLRHLDLFCLQVFPALCFVLCVNLFSTWYNFVWARTILIFYRYFRPELVWGIFSAINKKAFKSICYAGGTTILRKFALY